MEMSEEHVKYLVRNDDIETDITILKSFLISSVRYGWRSQQNGPLITYIPCSGLKIDFKIELRHLAFIWFKNESIIRDITCIRSNIYSMPNISKDQQLQVNFAKFSCDDMRIFFRNEFVVGGLNFSEEEFKKIRKEVSFSITKEDPNDHKNTSFMIVYSHEGKLIIIFHYARQLVDIVITLPLHKVKAALQDLC